MVPERRSVPSFGTMSFRRGASLALRLPSWAIDTAGGGSGGRCQLLLFRVWKSGRPLPASGPIYDCGIITS
jgi:hypothetical protein